MYELELVSVICLDIWSDFVASLVDLVMTELLSGGA